MHMETFKRMPKKYRTNIKGYLFIIEIENSEDDFSPIYT